MCLLHLVASLLTNVERLHERTKKTTNWNSLLRHSSYNKDNKKRNKKDPQINSVSPLKKEKKYGIFFFRHDLCTNPESEGGAWGEGRACRLWDQPMVREELEGKGIWRQIPLTIGSSVRDDRRYDRSEDKKQIEPIIIKSTHRFLCTRWTKIRSKRRRETDGTYYHQINT